MSIDFDALRAKVEERLDPEWVARYGDEQWAAALALIGEAPPAARAGTARLADFNEDDWIREGGKFSGYQGEKAEKAEKAEQDLAPRTWTEEMLASRDTAYTHLSDFQKEMIDDRLATFSLPVKVKDEATGKMVTLLDENGDKVMELQGPYELGLQAFQNAEDALQAGLANEASRAVMETWYADVHETSDHYAGALRGEGTNLTDDQMIGLIVSCSAQQSWADPKTGEPNNLEMAVGFARLWSEHPEWADRTPQEVYKEMRATAGMQSFPPFSSHPDGRGGTMMQSHIINAVRVMQSDGTYDGVHGALGGPKYLSFHEQIKQDGNGPTSVNDSHMLNIVLGQQAEGRMPADGHLMDGPGGFPREIAVAEAHGYDTVESRKEARAEWDKAGSVYMAVGDPIEAVAAEHNIPVGVAQAIMWGSDLKAPENAGGVYRGF